DLIFLRKTLESSGKVRTVDIVCDVLSYAFYRAGFDGLIKTVQKDGLKQPQHDNEYSDKGCQIKKEFPANAQLLKFQNDILPPAMSRCICCTCPRFCAKV